MTSKFNQQTIKKWVIGDFSWQRIARSLLFIYASLCIYAFFFSESLIFRPGPSSYRDNEQILKLRSTEGRQISAMYLPNPAAKYTILYSHGNAEDLGDGRQFLVELRNLGFNILAFDYQGYGTSEGTPSEKHTYADIEAAYNYLEKELKIKPERIIIYGRSVGGGPSVYLASRKNVGGLILESTFVSAFRVRTQIPLFPFDKFANLDKIKAVRSPVLIMHGKADDVVPFWHGKTLFDAVNSPKLSLWVEDAGHNDLFWVAGESYAKIVINFANLLDKEAKK